MTEAMTLTMLFTAFGEVSKILITAGAMLFQRIDNQSIFSKDKIKEKLKTIIITLNRATTPKFHNYTVKIIQYSI